MAIREVSRSKWTGVLSDYGIGEQELERARQGLARKFGREPGFGDVVWSLFNQLILRPGAYPPPYYPMALLLDDEGKDPTRMLREHARLSLQSWLKDGTVKTVKICTAGDQSCDSCRKIDGRVIPIAEALREMPLPCKGCTFRQSKASGHGFCRCMYVPEELADLE